MTVATVQDNLQLLAKNLQEHLRADVPSGEFFGVRCAVKNNQLMILAQHPQGVAVDTENIFTVLKEALKINSREYQQEKIEIYLRVVGVKLPYAKRSLNLEKDYRVQKDIIEEDFSFSDVEDDPTPDSSALTYLPISQTEESKDSSNSFLARNPVPSEDSKFKSPVLNLKLMVIAKIGVII